jgi:copper chaperone CopZ
MNQKKVFKVKGMHCHSCELLIKDCLEETPGVKQAAVSEKKATAEVEFDPAMVSEQAIAKAIRSCGYEVG